MDINFILLITRSQTETISHNEISLYLEEPVQHSSVDIAKINLIIALLILYLMEKEAIYFQQIQDTFLSLINIQQKMQSEEICPICNYSYFLPEHNEYIICSNSHSVCHSCILNIEKINSRCPFCRKNFSIADLRSKKEIKQGKKQRKFREKWKLLKKMGLCRKGHCQGVFLKSQHKCHSCELNQKGVYYKCLVCRYLQCSSCIRYWYEGEFQWLYEDYIEDGIGRKIGLIEVKKNLYYQELGAREAMKRLEASSRQLIRLQQAQRERIQQSLGQSQRTQTEIVQPQQPERTQ